MSYFQEMLMAHGIPDPFPFITDRELALISTLDDLFPNTNHLLCTWHVNMNVLAKCRKFFPADKKDPAKETLKNPQGYIPDPKWETFLKDWNSVLEAPTEGDFTTRLRLFSHNQPEKAVKYCVDVWLL
jgi:hypothetical protein